MSEEAKLCNETKHWYAVYTKPRWEKKVAKLAQEAGIIVYCPLNRVVKQWTDRKKRVEIPLFTSYIFVRVGPGEMEKVRRVAGVVNFVYWLGKPAQIRNEEIEAVQDFVNGNENIMIEHLALASGSEMVIDEGLFTGQTGIVKKVNKNRIELELKTLRMKLVVVINNK